MKKEELHEVLEEVLQKWIGRKPWGWEKRALAGNVALGTDFFGQTFRISRSSPDNLLRLCRELGEVCRF